MNIEATINTLRNNAIANYKAYVKASAESRKTGVFINPEYANTFADFGNNKVCASFSPTGRANCRRSLHTEGTVRWTLNGKRIAFAALINAVTEVAA